MTAPNPAHAADLRWLRFAVELSHQCPRVDRAYAVGAVVVAADGTRLATGYSRETDPVSHAEEVALAKLTDADEALLRGATIYSSLEPCSRRASRPCSCTQLILDAGIGRVVLAWREPPLFVDDAQGTELLRNAGVEVIEIPELAEAARAANRHLFE